MLLLSILVQVMKTHLFDVLRFLGKQEVWIFDHVTAPVLFKGCIQHFGGLLCMHVRGEEDKTWKPTKGNKRHSCISQVSTPPPRAHPCPFLTACSSL